MVDGWVIRAHVPPPRGTIAALVVVMVVALAVAGLLLKASWESNRAERVQQQIDRAKSAAVRPDIQFEDYDGQPLDHKPTFLFGGK
jgi:cytochrome oxidase Cu insertion factor (SCO1/SenC/PrrC family)